MEVPPNDNNNNQKSSSTTTTTTKRKTTNNLKSKQQPKIPRGIENEVKFRLKKQEETHKIQSVLIESKEGVADDYLKHCASFLQPSHYEDVVTERSLSGICGYPTCSNSISVPKVSFKLLKNAYLFLFLFI